MVVYLNRDLGLLRLGLASISLRVADIDFNIEAISEIMRQANRENVQVLAFPEMAITGYTIGDLVQQQALLNKALQGLGKLLELSQKTKQLVIVGMPLVVGQRIYNCAVVFNTGHVIGIVPKTLLANYKEFYEERWFTSSHNINKDSIELFGESVAFGPDLLFRLSGFSSAIVGVEICEDLWVPLSPHEYQALGGATLLINLSASNELLGKAEWRRTMVTSESGRCIAGYGYISSGTGESSNDVVYGGHAIIAENGIITQEKKPLANNPNLLISDIDIEKIIHDRYMQTSFHRIDGQREIYRSIDTEVNDVLVTKLHHIINPHPFVPDDPIRRDERCHDIFSMQVTALAQKLTGAAKTRLALGISGGLDSTLALLVAVKTMDYLGLPRRNVFTYTMPGFGTTQRTKDNATKLCRVLGVSLERVNINNTCNLVLKDLKHTGGEDVVFENVQARYRTEFLFNKANQLDAIVLGTGDLTEIALGWATFAGDQLSHYHVNASVPKTLVRYLIQWVADEELAASPAQQLLLDIIKTPISPELLRPDQGNITQKSEEIIGPVELADFYIYPFIRFGMRPGKILFFANEVSRQGLFELKYNIKELHHWLRSFIERFFANQFKRTCMPEGPKVGSVCLSPRGDWRMPSEAQAKLWLEDLDSMYEQLKPKRNSKKV